MNDVLAGAGFDQFGLGVAQIQREGEELDGLLETGRGLGLHQRAEFGGDGIHGLGPHAEGHALVGAESVNGDGKGGDDAVDGGFFEQQSLAAAGELHFAVGDLGDFEFGGDRLGNAFEFARPVEGVDEIAE